MAEPVSFVKAMADFFGRKKGQTLGEFQAELKVLNANDRAYFIAEFEKIGITVKQ